VQFDGIAAAVGGSLNRFGHEFRGVRHKRFVHTQSAREASAMKTKFVLFIVLLIAAGGAWYAQAAWRVKAQLVTLDVYQMPLREVLRKVERQTWRKIRAEEALDGKITLNVKNAPLTNVLDKIAMQAGARWATMFAVYKADSALAGLESALGRDAQIEKAGWTKLAPKAIDMKPPPDGPRMLRREAGQEPGELPEGGPPRAEGRMMVRGAPNDMMFFQSGDKTEQWSPQELLAETALTNRIAEVDQPTKSVADDAARKIGGDVETLIVFRKSIMGIGFAGGPGRGDGPMGRNGRFANLTPEQRLERARQRMKPQVEDVQMIRKGPAK
jgi:hypothetical protein